MLIIQNTTRLLLLGLALGLVPAVSSANPTQLLSSEKLTTVVNNMRSNRTVTGITNAASFVYNHPGLTSSLALGAGALCLAYRRSLSANWTPVLANVHRFTDFMKDPIGLPSDLKYWHMHDSNGLSTAADLMINPFITFDTLVSERKLTHETDQNFVSKIRDQIKLEKRELIENNKGLKNCLASCSILPAFEEGPNSVMTIINEKKKIFGKESKRFHELTKEEVDTIDYEIMKQSSGSVINPLKLIRKWVLPYESEAMRQYWKMYQLIARLDALEECLTKVQQDLNTHRQ